MNSTLSSDGRPSTSRVAVLGVPLIALPAAMAMFALALPLISGELPPLWFFLVGLLTPAALAIQWARLRARR